MTKRIFALILALLMVIPIVACAADDSGKPAGVVTLKNFSAKLFWE